MKNPSFHFFFHTTHVWSELPAHPCTSWRSPSAPLPPALLEPRNLQQRNGTQLPVHGPNFWPYLDTVPAPGRHIIIPHLRSIKPPYLSSGSWLLWPCFLRPVKPLRSFFVLNRPVVIIWLDPAYSIIGETYYLGKNIQTQSSDEDHSWGLCGCTCHCGKNKRKKDYVYGQLVLPFVVCGKTKHSDGRMW